MDDAGEATTAHGPATPKVARGRTGAMTSCGELTEAALRDHTKRAALDQSAVAGDRTVASPSHKGVLRSTGGRSTAEGALTATKDQAAGRAAASLGGVAAAICSPGRVMQFCTSPKARGSPFAAYTDHKETSPAPAQPCPAPAQGGILSALAAWTGIGQVDPPTAEEVEEAERAAEEGRQIATLKVLEAQAAARRLRRIQMVDELSRASTSRMIQDTKDLHNRMLKEAATSRSRAEVLGERARSMSRSPARSSAGSMTSPFHPRVRSSRSPLDRSPETESQKSGRSLRSGGSPPRTPRGIAPRKFNVSPLWASYEEIPIAACGIFSARQRTPARTSFSPDASALPIPLRLATPSSAARLAGGAEEEGTEPPQTPVRNSTSVTGPLRHDQTPVRSSPGKALISCDQTLNQAPESVARRPSGTAGDDDPHTPVSSTPCRSTLGPSTPVGRFPRTSLPAATEEELGERTPQRPCRGDDDYEFSSPARRTSARDRYRQMGYGV